MPPEESETVTVQPSKDATPEPEAATEDTPTSSTQYVISRLVTVTLGCNFN